jgi:cytochrome c oxidase subunit II
MRQNIFLTIAFVIGAGLMAGCAGWKTNEKMGSANSLGEVNLISGEIIDSVRVIKMTAQQYKYDPSVITVNQGDKVRLEITTKDVTHGFALKEYKIDRKIEPEKTTVIEFTADKAGTFEFHCSVFCGMGHLGMKGKLIVEPK